MPVNVLGKLAARITGKWPKMQILVILVEPVQNQKGAKMFYWHEFSTIKSSWFAKVCCGHVQHDHDFGRTEQLGTFLSNAQLGRKLQHLLPLS